MSRPTAPPDADIDWMLDAESRAVVIRHIASNTDRRVAACAPIRIDRTDPPSGGQLVMLCPGCALVLQGWNRAGSESDSLRSAARMVAALVHAAGGRVELTEAILTSAPRRMTSVPTLGGGLVLTVSE